jgi:hypothetical protein
VRILHSHEDRIHIGCTKKEEEAVPNVLVSTASESDEGRNMNTLAAFAHQIYTVIDGEEEQELTLRAKLTGISVQRLTTSKQEKENNIRRGTTVVQRGRERKKEKRTPPLSDPIRS